MTEQKIYKDSNNDTAFGNWVNTTFEDQALLNNDFELANALLEIPNELIEYQGEIGNQTLADFDYFFQIKVNGKSKIWLFDEVKETLDDEIKLYFENLIRVNKDLRN